MDDWNLTGGLVVNGWWIDYKRMALEELHAHPPWVVKTADGKSTLRCTVVGLLPIGGRPVGDRTAEAA